MMPEPLNHKPRHPDVGFETNEEVLFTEPELMAHSLRIADYRIYSGEVEGQNDAWLHVQNEQNINLSQCATLFSYVVKLSLSFRVLAHRHFVFLQNFVKSSLGRIFAKDLRFCEQLLRKIKVNTIAEEGRT